MPQQTTALFERPIAPPTSASATRLPSPVSAVAIPTAPAPTAPAAASETLPTRPSAPASLLGEWTFRAEPGKGVIAGTLRLRSAPSGISGVYVGLHGNVTELSNLRAAGDRVSFDLVTPTAVWHLEGTVSGDSIEGTFQTAERRIPWTAARKPASPPTPLTTRTPSS